MTTTSRIRELSPSQRRRLAKLYAIKGDHGPHVVTWRVLNAAGDAVFTSWRASPPVAAGDPMPPRGRVCGLEVVDRLGRPHRDELAEELLGRARADALEVADEAVADVVNLTAVRQHAAGANAHTVNLAAIARRAGLSRNTLYARLRALAR